MNNIFDKYHRKYDEWYDKNKFAYLSELDAVRTVIPEKGHGLEIGVGSGRFAGPLGIDVGIDTSKKMVEFARKRGVDARLGVGEKLSFKDSTFDYVAIIVTLCFVQDPEKVITESARVLKPAGKIIIGVIDKESSLGKFYQKKRSAFYNYAHFFTIEEIVQMLRSSGFSDFSYYQTIFDHPDKLNAVEKPQKGFGKGGFVVISAAKQEST
ncbi:class I SAM-dependent methyltransferase [Patescibacteria group bacterium]|nr:class I SAM-dependent methyltransferase [Candidatus Omnitrophota bacterium]MBU1128337.1 class I SAM-dependent methyltransferase [Candidatus Omnitrophota bacterium]MBU1685660.1 class I SAM-dependent methyltransferase [Patescibacteria group bacterium]MBU1784987.1 class I SAM-dependent methyltransferase [Candidatus Omnitrophota bacterium]MBU1851860.1 class I SAM-dependent methyltransferase [Candidatus Omnitrophota bacterium]